MKSDQEIHQDFQPLWEDIQNAKTFPARRPLLAHYTSIEVLEAILANNEVWFSNPLYMNDMEELRFGIQEGAQSFRESERIKLACGGKVERYNTLLNEFNRQFNQFVNEHVLDIYVFCLSEHESKNTDGLLSMWRGYGGNGNGAAIIFDTNNLNYAEDSPFIISNVTYASTSDRHEWIDKKLNEFADLLIKNNVPDDKLYLPLHTLFERIKIFSIFTKHHGFSEEREWRAVYLRERDHSHKAEHMLHYAIGKRGIEQKLKFKITPLESLTASDLSLEKIVSQIILGPSISSPLAVSAVRRMLEKTGNHGLLQRLIASSTPLRSA